MCAQSSNHKWLLWAGEYTDTVRPALRKSTGPREILVEEVTSGRVKSLFEIVREWLPKRYVTRLARLAFVSPVVAEWWSKGVPRRA
jgi:hypothetical protein